MKLIKFENEKLDLQMTAYDIRLSSQVLIEVCHGIGGINFDEQIGASEEEVSTLLKSMVELRNKMDAIYQEAKAKAIPAQTDFLESQNQCCLQADGFQVSFYLKTYYFPQDTKNIGIYVVLLTEAGFVELNVNSKPQPISMKDLWDFVINLEKYLELAEKNTESELPPFRSVNEIFQVVVSAPHSSEYPYFIIYFMIQISWINSTILNHCMGTKATVSLETLQNFATSFRQQLNELS
jgi:hypothetical protein